jgi:glycopeptide antibiotics resistance protein
MLTALIILYLPIFFVFKNRIFFIRQLSFLLLAGSVFIILFATILVVFRNGIIFNSPQHLLNLVPFNWVNNSWKMSTNNIIIQLVSNVLMFIPVGFLIPVVFVKIRSFWKTIFCVFVFTFFIETFQYFIGRSADIDDIILNLSGGIAGYMIFYLFSYLFRNKNWWLKTLGVIKR